MLHKVILTHLNALFDRIADRKGRGIAIRADKLFRLISKIDCNQIHLERYRRMLGVERINDKAGKSDKGYRQISRGPFLAMFKYEHLTFANSLESITRAEYIKKKKRKKKSGNLTNSNNESEDESITDASSNSLSHSTKSTPVTKTDFDERQTQEKTLSAYKSKRKQKKSKRKKTDDLKTGMIIVTDVNDGDLSSVSISPANSTNSNGTNPHEKVSENRKEIGTPLRERNDLKNHAKITPTSSKCKGRKAGTRGTGKEQHTPHDSAKISRRRSNRHHRECDVRIHSSDSEFSEDKPFLPSSRFSGNTLTKNIPEQHNCHENEYSQDVNEEYYECEYPSSERVQYQSNSDIGYYQNTCKRREEVNEINTYSQETDIKYESLDCSFFSGLMSLMKKIFNIEEDRYFFPEEDHLISDPYSQEYLPIQLGSYGHQQHTIMQPSFQTRQKKSYVYDDNTDFQVTSSTQRISNGQQHLVDDSTFGRGKRTYPVTNSETRSRNASNYYHYR